MSISVPPRIRPFIGGVALIALGGALAFSTAKAAAPPPPVPNGPAYREDFNDPKMAKWKTHGTFEVKSGKLILGSPTNNRENTWVYLNPVKNDEGKDFTVYTDFTVEMRARLVSDPKNWGGFGLWVRTNGAGQFRNDDWNPDGGASYVFNYTPGVNGVELLRRSHNMRFAGPAKTVPIDHNWHTYRVDAVGPNITAYFDGQKVLSGTFPEKPFGYSNGGVGIGVFNRGSVEVDWLRITPR